MCHVIENLLPGSQSGKSKAVTGREMEGVYTKFNALLEKGKNINFIKKNLCIFISGSAPDIILDVQIGKDKKTLTALGNRFL